MECAMPKLDVYRSKDRQQRADDNRGTTLHERLDRIFDNFELGFDLSGPHSNDKRSKDLGSETERVEIMPAA